MTVKRAVAGNFALTGAGHIAGIGFGVVTVGILTRALGAVEWGLYATAVAFLTTCTALLNLGLPSALLRMLGRGEFSEERVIGSLLSLRILLGVAGLALAPVLLRTLFDYTAAVHDLVTIGIAAYFFVYLNGAIGPVFLRKLVMGRQVAVSLAERALLLLLVIVVAQSGLTARRAMICLGVASVVAFAVRLDLARRLVPVRPVYCRDIWWQALSTSWPVALMSTVGILCQFGDMLVLAEHRDEAEVGIYGLSFRMVILLSAVPMQLMNLLLPILADAWKRQDRNALAEHIQGGFDLLALLLLPIVAGTLLLAEELVILIGGAEFAAAAGIFRLHIVAVAGLFLAIFYRYIGLAVDAQRSMIAPTILVGGATLTLYLLLIPTYGMTAAAGVKVFHAATWFLASFLVVTARARVRPRLALALKATVASGVMVGVVALLRGLPLPLLVAAGGIAYGAGILAMRAITIDQIRGIAATLKQNRRS